MIIIDENIIDSQRQLLMSQGSSIRQIGYEIGHKGMSDREIIVLLHELGRSTFITRDDDFFNRALCHHALCLVYLPVLKEEVASFVRRFLKHPLFNTQRKRSGNVIQVSHSGISFWRSTTSPLQKIDWI